MPSNGLVGESEPASANAGDCASAIASALVAANSEELTCTPLVATHSRSCTALRTVVGWR